MLAQVTHHTGGHIHCIQTYGNSYLHYTALYGHRPTVLCSIALHLGIWNITAQHEVLYVFPCIYRCYINISILFELALHAYTAPQHINTLLCPHPLFYSSGLQCWNSKCITSPYYIMAFKLTFAWISLFVHYLSWPNWDASVVPQLH